MSASTRHGKQDVRIDEVVPIHDQGFTMTFLRPGRIAASRSVGLAERVDDRALRWLAETPHGPARPILVGVSEAADLLLPWLALSAWWGSRGPGHLRRAALQGWLAIVLSAAIEDSAKPFIGRGRPDPTRLPARQRHRTRPSTSAFPSGHTAAATAFAVAASHEAPAWRPVLAATAAATTYSLVYTGRHYATDVVAGVLVGAAAGTLVRRTLSSPSSISDARALALEVGPRRWGSRSSRKACRTRSTWCGRSSSRGNATAACVPGHRPSSPLPSWDV